MPRRPARLGSIAALLSAAAGLIALATSNSRAAETPAVAGDVAKKAQAILNQRCFRCHGENGVAVKSVFVLDRARLLAGKTVVPGDTTSPLLKAVESGAMPPGTERVPGAEIDTLREWIVKGAADWGGEAKAPRKFIPETEILNQIEQDLIKAPKPDRPYLRYYSIAHLYNAGVSDSELEGYRLGLAKLVNSLTWAKNIIKPEPIDVARTLLRVDLRSLAWTAGQWKAITRAYPYGVRTTVSVRIHYLSGTEIPYIRADWFVASASVPPLYHEVLRLPQTVPELERMLGLDTAHNLDRAIAARAGMRSSGVSRNNRVVERHPIVGGAYWKSYDFAGNQGNQNIFADPLRFRPDGGEFIFNLPNGMQAYFIANAEGSRLDRAPINIVSDRNTPDDPVVVNGRSCMNCHFAGMKSFKDEIRGMVEASTSTPYDRPLALALYPQQTVHEKALAEDSDRFRKALEQTGAKVSVDARTEPVNALARKFGAELSVAQAAAEAGMEPKAFQSQVARREKLLALGFGQLLVDQGGVKRDTWEQNFPLITRELGLGEPINELVASGSGLKGEYYAGEDFQAFKLSRVDPGVDFTFGAGSPDPSIPPDHFSVRWTGRIQPRFSEQYTFSVIADDGARLFVDDQPLIDSWKPAVNRELEGKILLEAGRFYDLRLEFKEITGDANVRLSWSSRSQAKEVVPRSQLSPPGSFVPVGTGPAPSNPAPSGPQPQLNSQNGHYYQLIPVQGGVSWSDAFRAAQGLTFNGRRGHLATATNASVERFLLDRFGSRLAGAAWLGARQDSRAPGFREPDGGWVWVTGEAWSFTDWNRGEPSNSEGGRAEDYLVLTPTGWNDVQNLPGSAKGYLVEF